MQTDPSKPPRVFGWGGLCLLPVSVLIVALLWDPIGAEVQVLDGTLRGAWGPAAIVYGAFFLPSLCRARVRVCRELLESTLPGHPGRCAAVWVRRTPYDARMPQVCDGIFRPARRILGLPLVWLHGEEFHAAIDSGRLVSLLEVLDRAQTPSVARGVDRTLSKTVN